jgi:hypothetical protein
MLELSRTKGAFMALKESLLQIKSASSARVPAEAAVIMTRSLEQLEASGIVGMALGPGKPAPEFELSDWQGDTHNSDELLAKGPLILNFYRGSW